MSIAEVLSAFETVTSGKETSVWVKPYKAPASSEVNQFLFFFKPEVTNVPAGVNLPAILELGLNTLTDAGVEMGAVRIVGGSYLDKHNIMVQHYGVIAKISKEGVSAISDTAKVVLHEKFGDDLKAGAEVLGGHQFLAKFKDFNPFSLLVTNDNLGTTRLAGGTYVMKLKVQGKPFLVLNPFHAFAIQDYINPSKALIVYEGLSKLPWADLRQKLAGATDPAAAEEGSIRNLFLKNKEKLGLKDVDKGSNGIHMSAGPLEGLVELQRFFSDKDKGETLSFTDFAFGAYLASQGASHETIAKLTSNPDAEVGGGKKVSAFDLSEELSYDKAAPVLLSAKL